MTWRVALGILGLTALLALLWLGGEDALDSLVSADAVSVGLAFATTLGLTTVSSWRWALLTGLFGGRESGSFFPYYRSFILSRAAGLFVPQGASDFGLRPLIHRASAGGTVSSSLGGVTVERIADATLVFATGVPASLYILGQLGDAAHWGLLTLALVSWTLCFALLGKRVLLWLARTAESFGGGTDDRSWTGPRAGRLFVRLASSLTEAAKNETALRRAAGLSALRYLLIALQFTLVARALGLEGLSMIQVVAALPMAQLGAMVAITPGGIGFVEGGFFGGLELMDVPGNSVTAFLVGQRVLINVFILALAAVALASTFRGRE